MSSFVTFKFLFFKVIMIVAFPPHPFAYFFIACYLLRTPDNLNLFSISIEGSSYRESTVSGAHSPRPEIRLRFAGSKKGLSELLSSR